MRSEFDGEQPDRVERTRKTAILVGQLHRIVEELELLHPGRKFPLDGHLVGSLAEAAAEAIFNIALQPASTRGHDAISASDHRPVEIKGTYGTSGVALRPTSHDHASALIVLRLSRKSGESHEIVYNGPFAVAAEAAGRLGTNGQMRVGLNRLRALNRSVNSDDRIPFRHPGGLMPLDVEGGGTSPKLSRPVRPSRNTAHARESGFRGVLMAGEREGNLPPVPVVHPSGTCFCGCGGATNEGKFFVKNHDRRAESRVIKERFGCIAAFVVWADQHMPVIEEQ